MQTIAAAIAIGSMLPGATLTGADGRAFELESLRGRYSVVVQIGRHPAEGDQALLKELAGVRRDGGPVQVVPVFVSDPERVRGFHRRHELSLQVYSHGERLFEAESFTAVVNPRGRVVKFWDRAGAETVSAWLSGRSLEPDTVAPDPRPGLRFYEPRPEGSYSPLPMGEVGEPANRVRGDIWWRLGNAIRAAMAGQVERDPQEKGLLVMFLATGSPADELYAERIREAAAKAREAGIAVIGLLPSYYETAATAGAQARALGIPVALDTDYVYADAFRATRTPEVFLLNAQMRGVYTGAIDSSTWGEGTPYLMDAIRALSEGRMPAVRSSLPFGAMIEREGEG